MRKIFLSICIILISITSFSQTQKPDTATYQLIGKIDDFKLLYAAITSPDDVTANQKKAIAKWLESIKIIIPMNKPDSTAKQNPKK